MRHLKHPTQWERLKDILEKFEPPTSPELERKLKENTYHCRYTGKKVQSEAQLLEEFQKKRETMDIDGYDDESEDCCQSGPDKPLRRTAAESYENESDQEFIADSEENYSGSDSDVGSESSDEIERMNKNQYKRSRQRVLRRQNEKKEDDSEISSASSTEELSQKLQKLASSSSDEEKQPQSIKRRKRNKISSSSSEDEMPPKKIQQRRTRRTTRQNRYTIFLKSNL